MSFVALRYDENTSYPRLGKACKNAQIIYLAINCVLIGELSRKHSCVSTLRPVLASVSRQTKRLIGKSGRLLFRLSFKIRRKVNTVSECRGMCESMLDPKRYQWYLGK